MHLMSADGAYLDVHEYLEASASTATAPKPCHHGLLHLMCVDGAIPMGGAPSPEFLIWLIAEVLPHIIKKPREYIEREE